jgi:Tfp pilus tip-associated adhesin PilY1
MSMPRMGIGGSGTLMRVCALAIVAWCAIFFGTVVRASEAKLPGTVELSPIPLGGIPEDSLHTVLGMNSGVISAGTLAFVGGYDPVDWSGALQAVVFNVDGAQSQALWDASSILTNSATTSQSRRTVLTVGTDGTGAMVGMSFEPNSDFDTSEKKGLMTPTPRDLVNDTLSARVEYLRGDRSQERVGVMRTRASLLGAIINSPAVYVGYPTGHYTDVWPTTIGGISVKAPETESGAQTYDQFVAMNGDRPTVVYVGANDGMLHAFNAPVPHCVTYEQDGSCSSYRPDANSGRELWAFVPRGVYGGLGNLTSVDKFHFSPTVDATPIVRDVFFSERADHTWHTLLVGGLRLGGRGVYALDITRPSAVSEDAPQRTVLWEFDADAKPGISVSGNAYDPADLGYTYGQPAIARLANGRWAVLVASGYFPDCSRPDKPLHCASAVGTPPANYSALFILDAQTGEVIHELKTPTDIDGVTSYGLSSPVVGDYNDDQVDDVAFAGDLAGNLWRFDLSEPNPANWKVTLAYRPAVESAQPITVMPRLFPDPVTHRFMVVFGTGKYLGDGDNTDVGVPIQSVYGIRDRIDGRGNPVTVERESLQAQILSETRVTDPSDAYVGATMRSLTSNPVRPASNGWYIDLNLVGGERVVITPSALFNTNSVLVSTLIPNDGHSGSANLDGSVMAVDALTGGPGNFLSSNGGVSYVGGLVDRPRTTGMLPIATSVGGGKLLLPGVSLKGVKNNLDAPLSFGSPIWRRRSWSVLNQEP